MTAFTRRRALRASAAAAAALLLPLPALANRYAMRVALTNTHTGESIDTEFWDGTDFVPEACAEVDRVLRDHRTGGIHVIDLRLLLVLSALTRTLGIGAEPFHVISGYRSRATNEALRAAGHDVAANSYHIDGRAIDIRIPGRLLADLRDAAVALDAGGVGYYAGDDFIHVDTGPIRSWGWRGASL